MYRINLAPVFCLLIFFSYVKSIPRGALSLDELTLDKVISRFGATLIKFDIQYPYREVEYEFGQVSEAAAKFDDIAVGEIFIQDYGDYENQELGKRYNISKEQFPVILLFLQKNLKKPIRLSANEDVKAYRMIQFLKQYTKVRITQQNCLPDFDDMAETFMDLKTSKAMQQKLLHNAKEKAEKLTGDDKTSAEIYMQLMEKTMEKGEAFISQEQERIKGLLKSTITRKKGMAMLLRQRILQSFITRDLKTDFPGNEV